MKNNALRKILSIALVLVLAISLCACGKIGLKKVWSIETSVDEFGDVTENSVESIVGEFKGTFSDSTTSDNDFTCTVSFTKLNTGHFIASFNLLEDGETKAEYTGADTMVLKIKVGDDVSDYTMRGIENNDGLLIGYDPLDYSGDELFNYLYEGNDVSAVIVISASKYSFDIKCDNFAELCEDNGISETPAKMRVAEAVSYIIVDDGLYVKEAFQVIEENMDTMERLKTEDIIKEISGNFLTIYSGGTPVVDINNVKHTMPMMLATEYSEDGIKSLGEWKFEYNLFNAYTARGYSFDDAKKRDFDAVKTPVLSTVEVKDDTLIRTYVKSNERLTYCYYKLTDLLYIIATIDEETGEPSSPELFVRCREFNNVALQKLFNEIYENDIQKIK